MAEGTTVRGRREGERNRWLAEGGLIVTSTERAARVVVGSFNRAQQRGGRGAWASARVFWWEGWVRSLWSERCLDGGRDFAGTGAWPVESVGMSALQEQAVWAAVIRRSALGRGLVSEERLASAAARSFKLLAGYASEFLLTSARRGWSGEAGVLSEWVEGFTKLCRREKLMSASVLPLALADWLAAEEGAARGERAPALVVGFDRLTGAQRRMLDAWGSWRTEEIADFAESPGMAGITGPPGIAGAASGEFLSFATEADEIAACAEWLKRECERNPEGRWVVVAPGLSRRRGELERALPAEAGTDGRTGLRVEFSLGVRLGQTRVARSGYLLLRWLGEALSETEVEWLLGSGQLALDGSEERAMGGLMSALRRRGQERTEWSLESFCNAAERSRDLPWTRRLRAGRLRAMASRRSMEAWSGVAAEVLAEMGWPGREPLDSAGFQARERWDALLEECGRSVLLEESAMEWRDFLAILGAALSTTVFAQESTDANVLITEPLESAGLVADGVWFLGAEEKRWPGEGRPDALLPLSVQREAEMPHASLEEDWRLGDEVTGRILAAGERVVFSFARASDEGETRPSRLVLRRLTPERREAMEAGLGTPEAVEIVEDDCLAPCPGVQAGEAGSDERGFPASGGAGVLSDQSQCPFRAFARVRLGAGREQAAEPGISARQRGILVHDVMQRIWGGAATGGLRTLEELVGLADRAAFVRGKVRETMERRRAELTHETIPERLLEMEAKRLGDLVTEWLAYEAERRPFRVEDTEKNFEIQVGGLRLRVRQDRVDVVGEDESVGRLVIDYKTGKASPAKWAGERPEDLQLPLYGVYGVEAGLEGMVYARMITGEVGFQGRAREAQLRVKGDLSRSSALVTTPLTDEDLAQWRGTIKRLAEDFLAGHAEVDPKQAPATCTYCGLESLCRIAERALSAQFAESDNEGADRDD